MRTQPPPGARACSSSRSRTADARSCPRPLWKRLVGSRGRWLGAYDRSPDVMRDVEVDQGNWLLRAGETVGRYLIVEDRRRDQRTLTLRAYDPVLQREVALHCVPVDALSGAARETLLQRARAIAKLSHPNIIAIYDVEHIATAAGEAVVTATEYVGGTTLEQWVRDARPSLEVVKAYVAAGRGCVAAHRAGLLHRFEPSSVLIGHDGRVRLSLLGGEAPESPEPNSREIQHAFCVALWQALTKDISAPDIGSRELTIPTPVRKALRRGISPDESDRWPALEALLDALEYDHVQRRRRWLLAGAVSCSLVASAVAAKTWSAESPQLCSGARAAIATVWDFTRRDHVRRALLATGEAYAADVADRVGPALSRYASNWVAMHTEICEATTIRHEQSPEVMDLRMTCLHRAKVELAAVVELLGQPDAQVVLKASEVVASLPSLGRCSDVAALQADVPPPDPGDEVAVEAAQVELAEVKVLRTAGKVSEALARIRDLTNRIDDIAYAPLATDAWLELGLAHEGAGALAEAQTALLAALRSGLSNRQWEQAQAAATRLVYTVGHLQSRTREAKAYAATARGLLKLSEASAEATLRSHIGSVLEIRGGTDQTCSCGFWYCPKRGVFFSYRNARGGRQPVLPCTRGVTRCARRYPERHLLAAPSA